MASMLTDVCDDDHDTTAQADAAHTMAQQPCDAQSSALTVLWGTWEMWCDVPMNDDACRGADVTRARSLSRAAVATATTAAATAAVSEASQHTTWLDRVRSVGLFDSAEGFWGMFQCTILPSQLPAGTSYYLFRKHVAPMWEHEANRRGGKWVMAFTATAAALAAAQPAASEPTSECVLSVDVAWQRLCLALIGELLPCDEEEVCGVTVSRSRVRHGQGSSNTGAAAVAATAAAATGAATRMRLAHGGGGGGALGDDVAEWKLCLWTRSAEDAATQMRVAHYVAELLQLGGGGDGKDNGHDGNSVAQYDRSCCRDSNKCTSKAHVDKPVMSYVVHRDVMLAKQQLQHERNATRSNFAPRYVL